MNWLSLVFLFISALVLQCTSAINFSDFDYRLQRIKRKIDTSRPPWGGGYPGGGRPPWGGGGYPGGGRPPWGGGGYPGAGRPPFGGGYPGRPPFGGGYPGGGRPPFGGGYPGGGYPGLGQGGARPWG
ncbi:glycine-rich family protein [Ancylostoma duodenale]|uniref:Glycine-rich family protein n=1 Tax=Ancylostoma duodenale TaxID=51022 RepID=A0A0C2G6K4_9BILA|nr:glycine-rich family protein [Ancylostoma duodenale]